jgi:transcription factor IIIB 90 kDa subunit
MHDFIRSISTRLSNPGLSPRATTIFTQAMAAGHYRWGRRAKLTAGASIAIALRESHKPDSLRDITYLIDESFSSVSRAFTSVIALLQLDVPSSDLAFHLPSLQVHLHSLINPTPPPSPLPPALLKQISQLSLPSVMHTANSLCTLVNRLTSSLNRLTTPPTSCAILILSLEAEARTSILHCGELSQLLAARFGLAKGIVVTRYKMVYDLIEEWIREVPWLDQFETKGKEKGRSKVAKRIVVARGIKDVVQFQEEIWRKKIETQGKLHLELEEGDDDDKSDDDTLSTTTASSSSKRMQAPGTSSGHTRKKQKIGQRDLEDASQFLLNPLNSPLPAITDPSRPPSPSGSRSLAALITSPNSRSTTAPLLPLTSYLLTASASTLSLSHIPSRLQLLAAQRVGGAENVRDDELFGEGELDGFLRSEDEVEQLRQVLGWEEGTNVEEESDSGAKMNKGPKRAMKQSGTTRVDMDALAKLLQGDLDEDKNDIQPPDFDITSTAGLEEIEDWRPLSPDGGDPFPYLYDGMDRYDEEC